jgi:hypothetical protein
LSYFLPAVFLCCRKVYARALGDSRPRDAASSEEEEEEDEEEESADDLEEESDSSPVKIARPPAKSYTPVKPKTQMFSTGSKRQPGIRSGGGTFTKGTPSFTSLVEAEEACDYVVDVDLDHPDRNGGSFLIQQVAQVKIRSGAELAESVKVTGINMTDLTDFEAYDATLVLGGRALWIQCPTLPSWMIDLHGHFAAFHNNDFRFAEQHQVLMTDIAGGDPRRQLSYTLLVFPGNMKCTADFHSATVSLLSDAIEEVPIQMVKVDTSTQQFNPYFFTLRVVPEPKDRKLLTPDIKTVYKKPTLQEAYQSMNFGG